MRYVISLIAAAAVVACSDTPVEPGKPTGSLPAVSFDVLAATTDSSTSTATSGATSSVDTAVVVSDSTGGATATTGTGGTTVDSSTAASTAPVSALEPLYCPSASEVRVARGWIGPGGGSFGFRGHELRLPPGAVSEPTEFEILVPVSQWMEVEVHAVGSDSFLFAAPATITISFARCSSVPDSPLTAAYIDSAQQILQNMGGVVDRASKKVSFQTGHLSGFIVAY